MDRTVFIVSAAIVVPALSGWLLIRTLRRQSYKHWPAPFRWALIGFKWGMVAMGAFLWIGLWFQRGFWLGVLQVGLLAYVVWHDVIASPAQAAPP